MFGFSSISFSQEKQQKIKTNERNVSTNQQVNNSNKKAKQVSQESGKFSQFVKKYIITDANPAFGDKQNAFLGGVYTRSDNEGTTYSHTNKGVYTATIHYAQPIKIFRAHARLSAGFFTIQGAGREMKDKYQMYGMEIFPEIMFGNRTLYFTGGIGPSYIFATTHKYSWDDKKGSHLTPFNWSSTVGIGHRFDCGVVVEIHAKHYSNGGLGKFNSGFTSLGIVGGYTF